MKASLEWRPSAGLAALRQRAALLARIRQFFAERGVLEVETPLLARHGSTDPHLASFKTYYQVAGLSPDVALYLQTSPEYAMKRLLAAGSGAIYQITKAFRNGECGRQHNPEFSLLEWYRPGWHYRELMAEVESLVRSVGDFPAAAYFTYREIFQQVVGLDPHTATIERLQQCAAHHHIAVHGGTETMDQDAWLALLMTHVVEPALAHHHPLAMVYDYPECQAMLSRTRAESGVIVAERFELYGNGMELANGFQELTDTEVQRQRFEADRKKRQQLGLDDMAVDERLLSALAHGLPECSGVAMGVDRLAMLMRQATSLSDVVAFGLERA